MIKNKKHLYVVVLTFLIFTGCGGGSAPARSTTNETTNTVPVAVIIPKVSIFIPTSTGDLVEVTQPNPDSISTGTRVVLDGTTSYDADGNSLVYFWYIINKPINSSIILSSTASPKPIFVPDISGTYSFQLIVNDSIENSTPTNIHIYVK